MANAFKSKRVSHASANTSQKVFEAVAANTLVKSIMAFDTAGATITVYIKKVSASETSTYAFEKITLSSNVGKNLILDIVALQATDEIWITSTTNTTVYLLNYVEEDVSVFGQSVKTLVDWSNTDPTNGQVPVWNSTLNEYVPGAVSGSGDVSSVNGETGAVILDSTDIRRIGSTGDTIDTDLTAIEGDVTGIKARLAYSGTSTTVKVDDNNKITIDTTTGKAVINVGGLSAGTFGNTGALLPGLTIGASGSTYGLPAARGTTSGQVPVFNATNNTTSFQAVKVADLSGDSDDLAEGAINLFLTSAERTAISNIPSVLNDLDDVVIVDPLDHDSLVYDEVSTSWINGAPKALDMAVYSASAVTKGKLAKAVGSHGDKISIGLFDLDVDDPKYLVGIVVEDISAGGTGHVRAYGELRGISTDAYAIGTVLYASGTAGDLSTTAGTPEIPIAIVTRSQASTGRLFVRTWVPIAGVSSVNNQKGAVVLDTDDIAEGTTNKYFTTARVDTQIDALVALGELVKSVNGEFPDAGGEVVLTTDAIGEGATNKYYTDTKVDDRIDAWSGAAVTFGDTVDAQGAFKSPSGVWAQNQAAMRMYESTANGTNYVALKAPSTLSADVTWTMPSADGTSGQVFSTNGSGTTSWVTKKVTQVTGKTIATGAWTLVSGVYEASISDSAILSTSIVDVVPDNASASTIRTAQMLPRTDSSTGSVKIYSTNAPAASITVTLNIFDL